MKLHATTANHGQEVHNKVDGFGVGHCIHGNQDGVMSRGSRQDDLQTENTRINQSYI